MFVRIMSDLHLEFWNMKIYPLPDDKYSILVLAGDVGNTRSIEKNMILLKQASEMFKGVIYVLGNHEHYHGSFDKTYDLIKQQVWDANLTNVFILENETVLIDDVAFIGATLWTDLDKGNPVHRQLTKMYMADYHVIKNDEKVLNPQDTYDAHIISKKYIFKEIVKHKKNGYKTVVVTHHGISTLSTHARFRGDPMNSSFISDLSEKILDTKPDVWIHGHVHNCFQYQLGETRVIVNPRGYPNEQGEFDDVLTIEV